MGKLLNLLALAILLASASAYASVSAEPAIDHASPLSSIVGDNPEKRVLRAENTEQQLSLNEGTVKLATRLAALGLCTSRQAYQGADPSTLEWYSATAMSEWNDELMRKFPPSSELKFDRRVFEKAFQDELARRLGTTNLPQSMLAQSDYFSATLEPFTNKVYERDTTFGPNSTRSLQAWSADAKSTFHKQVTQLHADSKDLSPNCSDIKKGNKFWAKYSFFNAPKPEHVEKTLRKKPNIIERVLPVHKVAGNTEDLIDIAYKGSQVYRNRHRTEVGSKGPSQSIGRCAMYVAIALEQGGCMPRFSAPMSGGESRAFLIGQPLSTYGFKNIMVNGGFPDGIKNLYDVPAGAVLVYSGGDSGHVEIKTKSGFISDYYSANPRTGAGGGVSARGRHLTGIYVKPSCGAGRLI